MRLHFEIQWWCAAVGWSEASGHGYVRRPEIAGLRRHPGGLVAHLGAASDKSFQGLPKSWWAVLLQKRGAIHKHFRMHLVRRSVKGYDDGKNYSAHLSRLATILRFTCSSSDLLYRLRCAKELLLSFHCLDGLKLCHSQYGRREYNLSSVTTLVDAIFCFWIQFSADKQYLVLRTFNNWLFFLIFTQI